MNLRKSQLDQREKKWLNFKFIRREFKIVHKGLKLKSH